MKSNTTIEGGAGADTMVFNDSVGSAYVSLDSGADSVSFVTLVSGATMFGGGGTQTMVFGSPADSATFTGSFGGGYISLGAGNDNITFSGATVNGTTLTGAGDSDTIQFLGGIAGSGTTVVFGSAIGSASRISFGAGADYASFNAAVSAASIYGAAGDDTLKFANVNVNGSTLFGGADADLLNGGITIGSSGVSFWGGAGADTFNFTQGISNASGTAYFWNADAGTDSINLTGAGVVKTGVGFGVTKSAGLAINYGLVSDAFGTAAATTSIFTIASASNLATISYSGTTAVFLSFNGGAHISFYGAAGIAAEVSNTFGDKAGTIAFGTAGSFPTFS